MRNGIKTKKTKSMEISGEHSTDHGQCDGIRSHISREMFKAHSVM